MEVEKTSAWLMETNIDPRLLEDESTIGPIEESINVQIDPSEPGCVVKIDQGMQRELARELI